MLDNNEIIERYIDDWTKYTLIWGCLLETMYLIFSLFYEVSKVHILIGIVYFLLFIIYGLYILHYQIVIEILFVLDTVILVTKGKRYFYKLEECCKIDERASHYTIKFSKNHRKYNFFLFKYVQGVTSKTALIFNEQIIKRRKNGNTKRFI